MKTSARPPLVPVVLVTLLAGPLLGACRTPGTGPASDHAAKPAPAETPADLADLLRDWSAARGVSLTWQSEVGGRLADWKLRQVGSPENPVLLVSPPQSSASTEVIRLRYATASNLAETLRRVLASSGGGEGIGLVSDVRTNSLLVSADTSGQARVKALVDQLDIEQGG